MRNIRMQISFKNEPTKDFLLGNTGLSLAGLRKLAEHKHPTNTGIKIRSNRIKVV